MKNLVRWVGQEDSWGCAIACLAMVLSKSYKSTRNLVLRSLPGAELSKGLNDEQIRQVLAPFGLIVTPYRYCADWKTLERAVRRSTRVYAVLAAIGYRKELGENGESHSGVFGIDRRGPYFLDPNSARKRKVSHKIDFGRRRDFSRLSLDHYNMVRRV